MKMLMSETEFVAFVRRNLSTPTTFGQLTGITLPKKHADSREIVVEFASETPVPHLPLAPRDGSEFDV